MNKPLSNLLCRRSFPGLVRSAVVISFAVGGAFAQEVADLPPVADDKPLTLDELLGIEEEEDESADGAAAEIEATTELQRRLTDGEIKDAFASALEKMSISARLLDVELDAGLGTQRIQEEVLAKLDKLLDEARKQCSGGSCSGSAKQSSQSRQPGKKGDSSKQGKPGSAAGASAAGGAPPLRQDDQGGVIDESRVEWGNLPPRVREVLLQGRSDKFSTLYEQLTREYYRRLAEEGSS